MHFTTFCKTLSPFLLRRLLGNRDPAFVKQRRKELETYLQSIFQFLCHAMPEPLVDFLDLPKYDVNFVLRRLAARHHDRLAEEEGEQREGEEENYEPNDLLEDEAIAESWTPLEMHAISSRMQSTKPPPPQPASDTGSARHDFANVAERACQLKALRLTGHGSDGLADSDIVPNCLPYDFCAFRSLTRLHFDRATIGPNLVTALSGVRNTLTFLSARDCALESISHLLLCDVEHERANDEDIARVTLLNETGNECFRWPALRVLNLRSNRIRRMDNSLSLTPQLTTLKLGRNEIAKVENCGCLTNLVTLDLSNNFLEKADDLAGKLSPSIAQVDLAGNRLRTLSGVTGLTNLMSLDASGNRIAEMADVEAACKLPSLKILILQANMVTRKVDYRLKVLELFGQRCGAICLDRETPCQSEVDKVAVRMALRVAKEGGDHTALFGNLPRSVATTE